MLLFFKKLILMQTIKNIKFDILNLPVILTCKSYSKFLDADLKYYQNSLKLDVSYMENFDFFDGLKPQIFDKKYLFLIKKPGENLTEFGFSFYKLSDLFIRNMIQRYYIFFKEEQSESEIRNNKLDDLGI
jgi:hypothetical protein